MQLAGNCVWNLQGFCCQSCFVVNRMNCVKLSLSGGDGDSAIGFPSWAVVVCTISGGAIVSGGTYIIYELVKRFRTVDPLT